MTLQPGDRGRLIAHGAPVCPTCGVPSTEALVMRRAPNQHARNRVKVRPAAGGHHRVVLFGAMLKAARAFFIPTVAMLLAAQSVPQPQTTTEEIATTREQCAAARREPELWARVKSHCAKLEGATKEMGKLCDTSRWVRGIYAEECDTLNRRSPDARNAGWEDVNEMARARESKAKTPCELQWGNNVLMVEHCEKTKGGKK